MPPLIFNFITTLIFTAAMSVMIETQLGSNAFAACSDFAGPGVNWEDCKKPNVIVEGEDLTGANMSNAELGAGDFRNTVLNNANFTKASMLRASFSGSSAKDTNFESIIALRTDFSETTIENSNFTKSEISRADFTNATLSTIDFSKAELPRVLFVDATLSNITFQNTNLARADFTNSTLNGDINLSGSFMYLAKIEGLDLSSAKGMAQWQIDMACGNEETILPDGLVKPASWPCQE